MTATSEQAILQYGIFSKSQPPGRPTTGHRIPATDHFRRVNGSALHPQPITESAWCPEANLAGGTALSGQNGIGIPRSTRKGVVPTGFARVLKETTSETATDKHHHPGAALVAVSQ